MLCLFTKGILQGVCENFLKDCRCIYIFSSCIYSGRTKIAPLIIKSMEILPYFMCVLDLQLLFWGANEMRVSGRAGSLMVLSGYTIQTLHLLPYTEWAQGPQNHPVEACDMSMGISEVGGGYTPFLVQYFSTTARLSHGMVGGTLDQKFHLALRS